MLFDMILDGVMIRMNLNRCELKLNYYDIYV
jgi:hypothetical protein